MEKKKKITLSTLLDFLLLLKNLALNTLLNIHAYALFFKPST